MKKIVRNTLIPMVFASLIVGCGGSNTEESEASQLQTNPVTSKGQIDGFGSVIVNGVRYNTDNAVIVVNGVEVEEAELKVGYIVTVIGEVSEDGSVAVATRVEYSAELIGPVEAIDLAQGTITVLGQVVRLSEDTFFGDNIDEDEIEELLSDAVIEVSAFPSEDGTFLAAHIEIELEEDSFRLSGEISNVNLESLTLTINGQVVDISEVDLGDLEIDELENGMDVVVTGSLEDDVFVADNELEEHDGLPETDANVEVEIEGIVSGLTDNGMFEINGMRVLFDGTTAFEYGEEENLRNGLLVEVEGVVNDDGILVADEIELHRNAEMEFEGFIESIDLESDTFTVRDLTFTVTADTSFDDDSDMDERRFALDDLSIGDLIDVLAFTDFEGQDVLLAKRIRRYNHDEEDEQDDFEAEALGRIDVVEGNHLELHNGVTIAITEQTEIEGGELLLDIPREVLGGVIAVEGVFEGDILYAREVEILAWCGENGTIYPTNDGEISMSVLEICGNEEDEEGEEEEQEPANEEEENEEASGDDEESSGDEEDVNREEEPESGEESEEEAESEEEESEESNGEDGGQEDAALIEEEESEPEDEAEPEELGVEENEGVSDAPEEENGETTDALE